MSKIIEAETNLTLRGHRILFQRSLSKMSKNCSPIIHLTLLLISKVLPVSKLLLRYSDHTHCGKSPESVPKSLVNFSSPKA